MTQNTPTETPHAAPSPPERRRQIQRVQVLGAPVQYELKKLWPQGPEQTKFCQASLEVERILRRIVDAPNDPDRPKYEAEFREKKAALDKARDALKLFEMPIEVVVEEINEITGDMSTGMPARVEVIGIPFGRWAERELSFSARIPVDKAIISTRHPIEELAAYLEDFHAEPTEEETEEEEEEEETEEEETEPTAADKLVTATVEAVTHVTLEPREGGAVAIVPMAQWEAIRQAADDWAKEQEEAEEEETEEDEETDVETADGDDVPAVAVGDVG